jgi:hypothetical protein
MRKAKIVTGFEALSDADFETLAKSILQSMDGNGNFPSPVPALSIILTAVTDYSSALVTAQGRDKNAVAVKNSSRDTLTALLVQLASSVTTTANGDRVILVSSGFRLGKDGDTTPLEKPKSIALTDGINQGELISKVPFVEGAKSYGHQFTTDISAPAVQWKEKISTSSKYVFTGLVPGQKYWVQVAAYGSFNQVVYSDVISRIAQ